MISESQLAQHEHRIVTAAGTGETVDLRVGDAKADRPGRGAGWGISRTVRAEVLIELLTAERTPENGRLRAVRIRGARIVGPLDLEARTLNCPLLLQDCSIAELVTLDAATAATIRFPGCHVPALSAVQLHTTGNLELDNGFTAEGTVDLLGAKIGGRLTLTGASLTNTGRTALFADGLTVAQDMFCGATFKGEVRLAGAKIGGQLNFNGASLTNSGGIALFADRMTVERDMFCSKGFQAKGEVRLAGAKIGSALHFNGASLTNSGGIALFADRMTIEQDMFCQQGFKAEGGVRLLGARIGGQLAFHGASLTNRGARALNADRLTVEESMFCSEGFQAEGEIRMLGAKVSGVLYFNNASLRNSDGIVLDLETAAIAKLLLRPAHAPDGIVDFTNARVGVFEDEQATWPGELRLRGFVYETLENDQVRVRDRLRWLQLHRGYAPGIYDQLAAAYRRAGYTEAVRRVGVAKQRRRRSAFNPLNWLLYLTIGYGYRTWLAAIWLAALAVLGTGVFTRAASHHLFQEGSHAPVFHAAAYTLDLLVPIVDLGQRKSWTPHGSALYWSWTFIGAGWILTTAAVAGLTGIFKRD